MDIKEITVDEAKKYLDEGQSCFIDVRDPDSYESSHIKGAKSLNDSNIEDYISKADKRAVHIVYCYHGNSSIGAAGFFKEKGFENVYSMTGGFTQWGNRFNTN